MGPARLSEFAVLCRRELYLARRTISDIGPIRIACGMNLMAIVLLGPLALAFDQMFLPALPFSVLEWSVIGLGGITAIAYTLYVLTVKRPDLSLPARWAILSPSGVFWDRDLRRGAFKLGLGIAGTNDDWPRAGLTTQPGKRLNLDVAHERT